MRPVIKTKQDNAMTNSIGAIYAKNETELLWPTDQLSVTRDKNQIGQWQVWFTPKIKLSWSIESSVVFEKN